jgi:hypothetical protein
MSGYTNSVTNIVNSGYVNTSYSTKQIEQISNSIKNSAIDNVSFSDEAKKLFQISEIDNMFNGIFGIPNNLTKEQQSQLDGLRAGLDTIYSNNSSQLQQIDFEEIIKNLGITEGSPQQLQNLTDELSNYLTERSISQLFGNSDNTNTLSFLSSGYNDILGEKLTEDETKSLNTLSLQLNRLLFQDDNNEISSYLNTFNDLYGLKSPNENELFDASTLLTQRNSLLSSLLYDRSYQSTYTN